MTRFMCAVEVGGRSGRARSWACGSRDKLGQAERVVVLEAFSSQAAPGCAATGPWQRAQANRNSGCVGSLWAGRVEGGRD
jgi:hypothetical protein